MEFTMEKPEAQSSQDWFADQQWRGLFRASGILFVMTAVVWTVVSRTASVLYKPDFPVDSISYLELVSHNQVLASLTWSLWIVADFLLFAPTIAMYIILRRSSRTLALLGTMFAMFFNFYDISVTELNSLVLVSLANGYAHAPTDALRASFVSAATYGFHALPLQTVLSFGAGTFGYLLWCIPMLKSIFRRGTAIFGGAVMIIALAGSLAPLFPESMLLGLFQYICIPACALWFVLVGLQLYRYGSRIQTTQPMEAAA
jgi:hypothetical protein